MRVVSAFFSHPLFLVSKPLCIMYMCESNILQQAHTTYICMSRWLETPRTHHTLFDRILFHITKDLSVLIYKKERKKGVQGYETICS